jgi:hypothetical protein
MLQMRNSITHHQLLHKKKINCNRKKKMKFPYEFSVYYLMVELVTKPPFTIIISTQTTYPYTCINICSKTTTFSREPVTWLHFQPS